MPSLAHPQKTQTVEKPEEERADERLDEDDLNRLIATSRETGWILILNWAVFSVIRDDDAARALIVALARKLAEHYDPAPLIKASADDSD